MEKYEIVRTAELHTNKLLKIMKMTQDNDHSMYKKTLDRCKAMRAQLEECLSALDAIIDNAEECEYEEEVSTLVEPPKFEVVAPQDKSPSEIMYEYSKNIEEMSNSHFSILEASMCAKLLNSWFKNRYSSEHKNPKFYYNSANIHKWIDYIIISFGDAVHNNEAHIFTSQMNEWINSIPTDNDNIWPVPYSVQQRMKNEFVEIPYEAVVIEHLLKPKIYSADFFPEHLDSIAKMYQDYEHITLDFSDIKQCIYSSNLTEIGG